MLKREEIRIRDPFIFTDTENKCYYMYGTTDLDKDGNAKNTFSVYRTRDLENFEEPKVIVDGSKLSFWADKDFWAPEVHKYKGKYYLFGSCKTSGKCRGTHIFASDTPDGEFLPISAEPATPNEWYCLDGTLWIENDIPYMVFCHEWIQVKDGEICAIQLSDDFTRAVGEPFVLFRASETPNVSEVGKGSGYYITDGPFLYNENGKLNLMWSSFYKGKYQVLLAQSDSLKGKWEHKGCQFDFDVGHAMLFKTLDGVRMISLHSPNVIGDERAFFCEY